MFLRNSKVVFTLQNNQWEEITFSNDMNGIVKSFLPTIEGKTNFKFLSFQ